MVMNPRYRRLHALQPSAVSSIRPSNLIYDPIKVANARLLMNRQGVVGPHHLMQIHRTHALWVRHIDSYIGPCIVASPRILPRPDRGAQRGAEIDIELRMPAIVLVEPIIRQRENCTWPLNNEVDSHMKLVLTT